MFFSLLPADAVAEGIDAECRLMHFTGRRVRKKDRFHMTMAMLDDYLFEPPPVVIDAMRGAGEMASASAVEIGLSRLRSRPVATASLIPGTHFVRPS
jgi:hypothetical protein